MPELPPSPKSPYGEAVALADLVRLLSQAFLLVLVLLLVNEAAYVVGLPAWRNSHMYGKYPLGTDGLIISSWIALGVCLLVFVARQWQRGITLLFLGVIALLGPGVLSLTLHGGPGAGRSMALLVTSLGVVVAAAVAGVRFLGWLAFLAGGLIAWCSLFLGVSALTFWDSLRTLEPDTSGRYRSWLGPLTGLLETDRFGALVGVAPTRQTLGPVMAALLVVQVVLIARLQIHRGRAWVLLAPLACTLALLWSMSRTGILSAAVGLGVAFLPWNRLRPAHAVGLLWGLTLLTWAAPFLSAVAVDHSTKPQDTFAWRQSLWAAYLRDDGFFSVLGIGAQTPPPMGAGHAHNLLVESVANGGQMGFLGLAAFVLSAVYVALRARPTVQSVAVGVWAVLLVGGALELPVTVRQLSLSMLWFVALCTLGLAAGESRAQSRPQNPDEWGVVGAAGGVRKSAP